MVVPTQNYVDLESLLSKFKLTGPYYVKLLSLLIFSGVTNAFYSVNYVFAVANVDYRCKYPEWKKNSTLVGPTKDVLNISLNNVTFIGDRCCKYALDNGTCFLDNININTFSCDEWIYEDADSFMAELGCQDWKRTLVGTVHSFGYMIGLLITGPLADKVGRKKLIIFTGITAATMGLARSITTSYWVYIILELLEALLGDTYSTTFTCKYPEWKKNSTLVGPTKDVLNISLNNVTFIGDRCCKYALDNGTCFLDNININTFSCDEWIYEDADSFMAELGCQDWKRTLVGTVHSFGYMIGLLITGPLADKVGRKKLIIFTGITAGTMGLARSITSSYWVYIILELLEALLGDTYSTTFTLGVETVTKENRVTFITLMTASTSFAGMLMALIAWWVPYWRNFLRVIYGPSLFFICYIFLLDESIRWLLISGKKDDAKNVLKKAVNANKILMNEDSLNNIQSEKGSANTSLISLLKMTMTSKTILLRFLACVCMWITGIFNKYALLINSVELEGNKYINFGLTTLSELPASLTLAYVLKKFNRRIPLIFSFVLTGVFCVATSFVPKGNPWISTSLFLIVKFMATISYATVYLYTSELFPTYTRNTMHALCSSLGRIASILAPQTPLLIKYWAGFPSLLVGGLSLLTGVIVVMMPDTAEDVLPDTVCEAEALGSKPMPDGITSTRI